MELLLFGGLLFAGWVFDTVFDCGDAPGAAMADVEDDQAPQPANDPANGIGSDDQQVESADNDLPGTDQAKDDGLLMDGSLHCDDKTDPPDEPDKQVAIGPEGQGGLYDPAFGSADTTSDKSVAVVSGFDPENDQIELEFPVAPDNPTINVRDMLDSQGASISLNGVVVAEIYGAQGLKPENVFLTAI